MLFKATEFFLLSPCNSYMMYSGHGGSRAAEYLKGHLFENLLKHPQFMADTKLAISKSKFSYAIIKNCITSVNILLLVPGSIIKQGPM